MEDLGFEWLTKAFVYGLLQVAIGLAVARALARRSRPSDPGLALLDRWLARAALVTAALLLAAHVARAWAHTAMAFGAADSLSMENLSLIVLESRWGESWRLQLYAAGTVLLTATALRVWRPAWIAYAAAVFAAAAAIPLLGHAGGSAPRHALHLAHLLGGGAWLGTLAVLVGIRWQAQRGTVWAQAAALSLVGAFSPLALGAAALAGASGVVATWLYVGAAPNLLTTNYGRALLFKLACVFIVLLCGRANWQRARVGLDPKLSVMVVELGAAAAVVLATGVLTETEQP
jgi:copper transport protein